jgi:chaperonin GroES
MKIKPILDRICVLPESVEDQTKGGIVIVDKAKDQPAKGTVIGVGGDVEHIREGDRVMFVKKTGEKVKFEDVEYIFLKEEQIMGIIK